MKFIIGGIIYVFGFVIIASHFGNWTAIGVALMIMGYQIGYEK